MNNYTENKDKTLVELTLAGDDSAFAELVERHEGRVLGTAMRVTKNKYSAEDAAQDAFVSAWMNLDSLRDGDRFASCVCSIASNRAKNLVAHYIATCADVSFDAFGDRGTLALDPSSGVSGEALPEPASDDTSERLYEELDALSPILRETLRLHYFDGYSVAEIAERLAVPVGTVKWRLSEGRKQLRKGYGVMEKNYNENEKNVERVMRQIEALKLWRIKRDKTGFEQFYRELLSDVEALDDSQQKQHALADVLEHGYWWIAGNRTDEMIERMKKAAIEGKNENAMNCVMANMWEKYAGEERRKYMRETLLVEAESLGFTKTAAYVMFWLANEYHGADELDEAERLWKRVIELLTPADVYYANAKAALFVIGKEKIHTDKKKNGLSASGEIWRIMDDKLLYWEQPGFMSSMYETGYAITWNMEHCDSILLDYSLKPGDVLTSVDGRAQVKYSLYDKTVETPAGAFENCILLDETSDESRVKHCLTWLAPNVGIVMQESTQYGETKRWRLSKYRVSGEGLIPLAVGNHWEYACDNPLEGQTLEIDNYYEITDVSDDRVTLENGYFATQNGYVDNWIGAIVQMRNGYYDGEDDNEHLVDVEPYIRRAEELASTKREKIHTRIAADVMRRILACDAKLNPDRCEDGKWNFFERCEIERKDGKILMSNGDRNVSFEWKELRKCPVEGYKLLYNFLYDILSDGTGCVWSDEWIVGYKNEYKRGDVTNSIEVIESETVETPAGVFDDCRTVKLNRVGARGGQGYRGGKFEYTFANGVGLVRMSRPLDNDKCENIWQLTAYNGEGEGFFPMGDGFFRRYEPKSIKDGWRASVEYTFDEDETGMVVFRNALGNKAVDNKD